MKEISCKKKREMPIPMGILRSVPNRSFVHLEAGWFLKVKEQLGLEGGGGGGEIDFLPLSQEMRC